MACDFAGRAFMSARFLRFYSYRPQSLGILYVAVYAVFMVVRAAKGKKARSVNMIKCEETARRVRFLFMP